MFKAPTFPNVPVLVVDDSAFARRILRGMLETVGMRHVIEAVDGGDALDRLSKFKPSLIILDWTLPVLGAKEVLDVLRDPKASTETLVPVIIMTAHPTRRLVSDAARRNVKHVLKKPFGPKMLWQRIATFFEEDPSNLDDIGPEALLSGGGDDPFSATGRTARARVARSRSTDRPDRP
jgi:two-component system, chemotaxis family, chemotaxis protein CheY